MTNPQIKTQAKLHIYDRISVETENNKVLMVKKLQFRYLILMVMAN